LGLLVGQLAWQPRIGRMPADGFRSERGRPVGKESRKSFDAKIESGFWARFVTGPEILDIGFQGGAVVGEVVPILPGAVGVDLDFPGYDGRTLPFANGSQDAVYSSHCLEHIPDYVHAIQEWHRVTRVGGHIITVVPSMHLYERRRRMPSRWNGDHKRVYSPSSLLAEFEAALAPNSYRVRHLAENDAGYDYGIPPSEHARGCFEIELVVQKIAEPEWRLAD
jgi:SAM-dependent methyltransferase